MHIGDLRIEYQKVPFGISEKQPRFSWKLISEEPDTMQVPLVRIMEKWGDDVCS